MNLNKVIKCIEDLDKFLTLREELRDSGDSVSYCKAVELVIKTRKLWDLYKKEILKSYGLDCDFIRGCDCFGIVYMDPNEGLKWLYRVNREKKPAEADLIEKVREVHEMHLTEAERYPAEKRDFIAGKIAGSMDVLKKLGAY